MTQQTDPSAVLKAMAIFGPLILRVLSERILTFCALSGSIGLFITAICQGTIIALGVACAYTVLVFMPVMFREGKQPVIADSQ